MRAGARGVAIALALTSCGTQVTPAEPSSPGSPVAAPATTSTQVKPIRVGGLPDEGVAVGLGHDVLLLDLDGGILGRVRAARLYFDWEVPGSVVARRGERFFVLDVDDGVFRPLAMDAAGDLDPQFQSGVDLPPPPRTVAGRWAYALPGPDDLVLAQWSGECEVPNAMFVPPGAMPRSVTGERSISGPNSMALGWDDRGRALVHLHHGAACGTSFERPGVYAFTGPGVGTLVFGGRVESARMWGAPA